MARREQRGWTDWNTKLKTLMADCPKCGWNDYRTAIDAGRCFKCERTANEAKQVAKRAA